MEYVACSLCGSDQPRYLCSVRQDRFLAALGIEPPTATKVMCCRCGHVYANPQFDRDELEHLYRDVYRSPQLGATQAGSEEYLYWKRKKAASDYEWISSHLPQTSPGRMLEVGCAEGSLLHEFARRGWNVLGIEPTTSFASQARERFGIEVLPNFVEDAPLDDRRFDVVVALVVLEHLKDPIALLSRIGSSLAPDGRVVVAVPNICKLGRDPDEDLASPHLSLFATETLDYMFRAAGLAPIRLEHWGEELMGLAAPGGSSGVTAVEPAGPAHSLMSLRVGVWRARARSSVVKSLVRSRQVIKRGLVGILGSEAGDALWQRLRHWSGRS